MDRRRPEPGAQLHDYIASSWLPAVTLKKSWVYGRPGDGSLLKRAGVALTIIGVPIIQQVK